jgi:hypothetical protein
MINTASYSFNDGETCVPPTSRQFMRRIEAAAYLNGLGLPVAVNTLMKLASVGGGPTFRRFGRFPVYTRSDLDAWARSRLSRPMASTSDKTLV